MSIKKAAVIATTPCNELMLHFLKLNNKWLGKCCLVWSVWITAVKLWTYRSEFSMNDLKASIHPALYQQSCHVQSHLNHFSSHYNAGFELQQVAWTMSSYQNALSRSHVTRWLEFCINKQFDSCTQQSDRYLIVCPSACEKLLHTQCRQHEEENGDPLVSMFYTAFFVYTAMKLDLLLKYCLSN